MSRSVNSNLELLRAVVLCKPEIRVSLLKAADKSLVIAICECALNVINGNVRLPSKLKKVFFEERNVIRILASSKVNAWRFTRNIIVRKCKTLIPLLVQAALEHFEHHDASEEDSHELDQVTKTKNISQVSNESNLRNSEVLDPVPLSSHFLIKSNNFVGNGKSKRRERKVCKICFEQVLQKNDRTKVQNMTKVSTLCRNCPNQPFLCKQCFEDTHGYN